MYEYVFRCEKHENDDPETRKFFGAAIVSHSRLVRVGAALIGAALIGAALAAAAFFEAASIGAPFSNVGPGKDLKKS